MVKLLSNYRYNGLCFIVFSGVRLSSMAQSPTRVLNSGPINLTGQAQRSQAEVWKASRIHACQWSAVENWALPLRGRASMLFVNFQTLRRTGAGLIQ